MMQPLKERWRHLAPRERLILAIGGAVVAGSLLFLLIIDPLLASIEKLERQAIRKQKERAELALLAEQYAAKQAKLAQREQHLPPAGGTFSLLAYMEEAATTAQVRDRIVGMQPQQPTVIQGYQESAVDLRLDGVQLPQLLALLVAMEEAPYDVQVRHLQVKPKYDNPVNLDASLRIVTYQKS
ncbi:MAG TPA: type II secretion system protein GspM [Nitrospira sp.]|nr:type II secretion system protein GspM [Nitrospira sp.]